MMRDKGVIVEFKEYKRNVIRIEKKIIWKSENVEELIKEMEEVM